MGGVRWWDVWLLALDSILQPASHGSCFSWKVTDFRFGSPSERIALDSMRLVTSECRSGSGQLSQDVSGSPQNGSGAVEQGLLTFGTRVTCWELLLNGFMAVWVDDLMVLH